MKTALRITSICLLLIAANKMALADDRAVITDLLQEFLAASNTRSAHENFWSDDLVYTSSNGTRFGKADILASFDDASDPAPAATTYSGDQVDVRLYGDTAVVAFRLIGTSVAAADDDILYYFNTGTFLKRNGVWSAVAWQATKIPPQEESQ